MYLMIDNKDSFVYNLAAYFRELGCQITVRRADQISFDEIGLDGLRGIIISPGPGKPEEAVLPLEIVRELSHRIPILGVCLGHQVMAHAFGGTVQKGERPMHGKLSKVRHTGVRLFQNLPPLFSVTRYHSLVVKGDTLGGAFTVDAYAEDGAVMGISHRTRPLYGIQFHPEAVLTEHGHALLRNFLILCDDWWDGNA